MLTIVFASYHGGSAMSTWKLSCQLNLVSGLSMDVEVDRNLSVSTAPRSDRQLNLLRVLPRHTDRDTRLSWVTMTASILDAVNFGSGVRPTMMLGRVDGVR